MRSLILAVLLSCCSGALWGQSCTTSTCNAASPSQADFLAALPSTCPTGTTIVNIPAGTANWTGQLTATVPANCTNLRIQGATTVTCTGTPGTSGYACSAVDTTIIQDNIAANFGVIQLNGSSASSSPIVRVTGITFRGGTGATKFQGLLLFYSGNATAQQIRFDHNHFNLTTGGTTGWAGRINGCTKGVIDHNVFDSASPSDTTSVAQGFMVANNCHDTSGFGDGSWGFATNFGSDDFVFFEANVFNGGLEGDCDIAGKFVSRYNTINSSSQSSSWIHTHGTESNGGRVRGCRAFEAWKNYFHIVVGAGSVMLGADGGTALVWGNTLSSTTATFIGLGDERNDGQHGQGTTPGNWAFCGTATIDPGTGSANLLGSGWDGNNNAGTGWPCIDGLGRVEGTQVLNGANFPSAVNATTGTIAWTHELLYPFYAWMNGTASSTFFSNIASSATVNRDYFGDNPAFNGTTGTGYGLLSSLPPTCTAGPGGSFATSATGSYGVAYFATDANSGNGELYACTSTNTWTPIYQPYVYPHPLDTSGAVTVVNSGFKLGSPF